MKTVLAICACSTALRAPTTSPRHRHALRSATLPVEERLQSIADAAELSGFAARVEDEVVKRFGEEETKRVRTSWRLIDQDYVHHEQWKAGCEYSQQEARSFLPGLQAVPFWDMEGTEWAKKLEANWEVVRDEFKAVALLEETKRKGNNVWVAAADSDSAQKYGADWRTLVLMDHTTWDPTNCLLFPKTARLLTDAGVPCVEAFFASMKPRSKINPHTDSCNFILTSHLGLEIPPGCHLRVGDETRAWEQGKVSMFDTSIYHDAVNDSDENRYILMLRVWHPDLSPVEVRALQFLFDVLDVPGLISDDPVEVFRAEAELAGMRSPPEARATLAPAPAEGAPKLKPKAGKAKKKRKKSKQGGFGVAL